MSNGVSVFTLITRTTMQYSICTMYMLLYVQPFNQKLFNEVICIPSTVTPRFTQFQVTQFQT